MLVTGANGHLGRRLIGVLLERYRVEAVVRSERAARRIATQFGEASHLRTTIIDPKDAAALAPIAARCRQAVHLIGTIRAGRSNPLEDSHERPARALVDACRDTGLGHIVYISILGASHASACACLRARAAVEDIFAGGGVRQTTIRVPMVLGERDRASLALAKRALARRVVLFRGASLEQPIYAGDVIAAVYNVLADTAGGNRVFDLAGPESVTRRELVLRAAALRHMRPVVVSLPVFVGFAFATVMEWLRADPPITRDMLKVLDHDDAIDSRPAATALGIELTPLATMLERCVADRIG